MRNRMMVRAAGALALVLFVTACASAGAGERTRIRQDVITEEELREVGVSNLYEVVQRLRPRWLNVRSSQSFNMETEVLVYQDQTQLGGVDVLRQMSPEGALRLRYLDGPTASASLPGLGSRHVAGAIVIETSARRQ